MIDIVPISLVGGKGGNGKSLYFMDEAMRHWVDGHCVAISDRLEVYWDTFKIDPDTGKPCLHNVKTFALAVHGVVLRDEQFVRIPISKVKDFHRHIPHGSSSSPVLALIDEAHEDFNARNWAEMHKNHAETLSFATHCRHYHVRVIFATQAIANLDKQFRALPQNIWRMKDMTKIGFPGIGHLPWPFPWWRFLRIKLDEDGKTCIGWHFFTLDKRLYDTYDTFNDVEGVKRNGSFKRLKLDKKGKKLTMKTWIVIIFIFAVMFYYGVHRLHGTALGKVIFHEKPDVLATEVSKAEHPVDIHQQLPLLRTFQQPLQEQEKRGAYDLLTENFKGWVGGDHGDDVLVTDAGLYQVGQMSIHGFVKGVSYRLAEIIQPDGRLLLLSAVDHASGAAPDRVPPSNPINTVGMIAHPAGEILSTGSSPWFQRDTSWVDSESQRIRKNVSVPIRDMQNPAGAQK